MLVAEATRAWQALGKVTYGPTEVEVRNKRYRRSLYVVGDMKAGEAFSSLNVRSIRPGLGLAPKHLPAVLGRIATRSILRGTPLSWDLLE